MYGSSVVLNSPSRFHLTEAREPAAGVPGISGLAPAPAWRPRCHVPLSALVHLGPRRSRLRERVGWSGCGLLGMRGRW